MALRRDGGLGGNGAAALASGFDEAVGDDLLDLVDMVGSGRGFLMEYNFLWEKHCKYMHE